ncbi:putative serine/threonine-protein kinase-like protein CCR3 [Senna tora]|uniref:Putative serine/threonine-protein kinase-like protein CCR3 n=1 Tax=Senna tora TaxID=362788 RepID=A0A834WTQ2_9FABA|nr:putative serine/threonine-protein kinase-like protein CCR3 [Senna tora]
MFLNAFSNAPLFTVFVEASFPINANSQLSTHVRTSSSSYTTSCSSSRFIGSILQYFATFHKCVPELQRTQQRFSRAEEFTLADPPLAISTQNVIRAGSYSVIYRRKLTDGSDVAIKRGENKKFQEKENRIRVRNNKARNFEFGRTHVVRSKDKHQATIVGYMDLVIMTTSDYICRFLYLAFPKLMLQVYKFHPFYIFYFVLAVGLSY